MERVSGTREYSAVGFAPLTRTRAQMRVVYAMVTTLRVRDVMAKLTVS